MAGMPYAKGTFGAGSSRITEADNQETVAAANRHNEHEGHAHAPEKRKENNKKESSASSGSRWHDPIHPNQPGRKRRNEIARPDAAPGRRGGKRQQRGRRTRPRRAEPSAGAGWTDLLTLEAELAARPTGGRHAARVRDPGVGPEGERAKRKKQRKEGYGWQPEKL